MTPPAGNRTAVTDPPPERPRRPAEVRLEAAARSTRRIAVAALVLATAAVLVVGVRLVAPADAGCQPAAWGAAPAVAELPLGWAVGATQYDVDRKSMTFLGPAPTDTTTNRAVVYATITCYPQGAADSVSHSAQAATDAGQVVTNRQDLGEQAFSAADTSGARFLQFRRGSVVVYLAASGEATAPEVDAVAVAFDHAMGGAAPGQAVGTPDPGTTVRPSVPPTTAPSPSPSADAVASPSAAAPDLEALLPTTVGSVTLTRQSALGPAILGTDQGSRAIVAALRADGRAPTDLRVAQASDPTGQSDLTIIALAVTGMHSDALRALVLDSWLAATGAGVKTSAVTLAGHAFTRVDYGDGGSIDYVLVEQDRVIIIETASLDTATEAAAVLP